MKSIVCVCVAIVACLALAHASEKCETPPTWEARIVYSDPDRAWGIHAHHSQDGEGERVSVYEEIEDFHEQKRDYFHRIWHYKTGYHYKYDLQRKNCTYWKHEYEFRPIHIPDSAKFITDLYVGSAAIEGGSTEVGYWYDQFWHPQVGQWEAEFTLRGCVPVREWYEDTDQGIIYQGWYNVVLGISDPSIFDPYPNCKLGEGLADIPPYAAAHVGAYEGMRAHRGL